MKIYIKSSKHQHTSKFQIVVEFKPIESYITEVFAAEDLDSIKKIICDAVLLKLEDVIDVTKQLIKSKGLILDDVKPSPNNIDDSQNIQQSFYVYFHNPNAERRNLQGQEIIEAEIKLKITDHEFTTVDTHGNIIIDEKRIRRDNSVGSEFDRQRLEEKLKKIINTVVPERILVEGHSSPNLYKACYDISKKLDEFV